MIVQRQDYKSHFQLLLADLLAFLANENTAFSARMPMSRICMSLCSDLHRKERVALLSAQQIDDDTLCAFLQSIVKAGGKIQTYGFGNVQLTETLFRYHAANGYDRDLSTACLWR